MRRLDDTIAAIASAAGGPARGIVRVSGTDLLSCLASCFRAHADRTLAELTSPGRLGGELRLKSGRLLPTDLLLWPDARSYTRQPVAELHTFGSPPLLAACLDTLCAAGARVAEPGEFTLRAFLAGRIDLVQAEAVLGVIDAQGDEQLARSLVQLAGGMSRPLQELREQLLVLLSQLEAGLDFVEEEIQFLSQQELLDALDQATQRVGALLSQMASRSVPGGVPRVVLAGWPNVGKSSLFNRLAAQHAGGERAAPALVSAASGTTRDYLTATVCWGGFSCELVDTAGVGPTIRGADVEAAAQSAAADQREHADLVLCCLEATRVPSEREWDLLLEQTAIPRGVVLTKADLASDQTIDRIVAALGARDAELTPLAVVSSQTRRGLPQLCGAVEQAVSRGVSAHCEVVATTAIRCRESLRRSVTSLTRASTLVTQGNQEELVALELRVALEALGTVVGAVYTDEILDHIFSRFCIGK